MRRCYVCFMSRRRLPMIVIAGVLFLVVSGATLVWRRVEFGWTAFGSTTSDPPAPGVIVLDGLNVVAVLGVLVGVALITGVVGFRLGRRHHRPPV